MLPHPLNNFEMLKYYQTEPNFNNGVYSRNNSPKVKDEEYVINLDDNQQKSTGTHWIALYVSGDNVNTLIAL